MQKRGCGIFFFVVLVAACFLFGCPSGSSDKERAAEKPGEPQTVEALPDENKPGCTIAPGSSRTFSFTGPVPFFHSTDTSPSLEIEYGLAGNSWKDGGVEVSLNNSHISRESGDVWTFKAPVKDLKTGETYFRNRPIDLAGNPAPVKAEIAAPGRPMGGDVLVQDGSAHKFLEQGNMSFSKVKKEWKIDEKIETARKNNANPISTKFNESGLEKKPFAFYRFTVGFTVSIPGEDRLKEIDKNSRFNQIDLYFYPRLVVFKNDQQTREWTLTESFNRVPVVMSLSRKPGGGYNDVVLKNNRNGYELTCE